MTHSTETRPSRRPWRWYSVAVLAATAAGWLLAGLTLAGVIR